MMRSLAELIRDLNPEILSGDINKQVSDLHLDSREVGRGSAFIAMEGVHLDGHYFIGQAIENGATVVFLEKKPEELQEGITYIRLRNARSDSALLASAFYDHPSENLTMVGVTGTNGKTTVATLLYKLFTELGFRCGLFSTVEILLGGRKLKASHTTPDPKTLHKTLATMRDEACSHVFMEVSSHALDQDRVKGIDFKGRIFTNLTHDHLDYHQTFKSYLQSKKKFFDSAAAEDIALSNLDDKNGKIMLQNCNAFKRTYSLKSMSDYKARILDNNFSGLHLRLDDLELHCNLIGKFNAYNLLAVYGMAVELGQDPMEVCRVLSGITPAAGRFEVLRNSEGTSAIIDYAHTPDALENVLSTIMSMLPKGGKLITVVGCGGDRDTSKRPEMARIGMQLSTQLILTSDNPRSENPEDIIDDMMEGIPLDKRNEVLRITDRKQAIITASKIAGATDVILVAGKGHENYQEIKGVKQPFDDRKVLNEVLFVL